MTPDKQRIYEPVQVFVPGTPRPQPRPRFSRGIVVSTADPNAKRWRHACTFFAKQAVMNLGGPSIVKHYLGDKGEALRAELNFFFPIQGVRSNKGRRYGTPHVFAPDADNLAKLAIDCFVDARLILGSDSRVSELIVRKNHCKVADAGMLATLTLIKPREFPPEAAEKPKRSDEITEISATENPDQTAI